MEKANNFISFFFFKIHFMHTRIDFQKENEKKKFSSEIALYF